MKVRAARRWSLCGAVPRTREGVSLSRASWWLRRERFCLDARTWVQSLSQDPLEQEMATTPVFVPREFHGPRPGGLQSWGCKESDTANTFTHPYHWQWGPRALPFSWALSGHCWKGSCGHLRVHLCDLCISWTVFCSQETAVAVWLGRYSGVRLPRVWPAASLVWPWVGHLNCQCHSSSICKMGQWGTCCMGVVEMIK